MILTVDQFREHVTTSLVDDAVERLLDAAESAIVAFAGEPYVAVELVGGGSRLVALSRAALEITSITETLGTTVTTLATDDYLIHPGGLLLERLSGGTNSRWRWNGRITVTYIPVDDSFLRIAAQVSLVKLEIAHDPGATRERIGSWEEEAASTRYLEDREYILCTLRQPGMVVV